MKVRYYGSAGYPSGYGVAASELALALIGAGADLELRVYGGAEDEKPTFEGDTAALANRVRDDASLTPNPDVVIVHAQPFDCRRILRAAGITPGLATKCIAYTTWEGANSSDDVQRALRDFDQVWVPSTTNKHSLGQSCDIDPSQVKVIPHCFDEDGLADRRGARLPGGPYRFYFIGHWNGRKNPTGLIRAWARAFTREDDVELVIQSTRAREHDVMIAVHSVGASVRERMAPIKINASPIREEEIRALHRGADCFVSTTRWESFNLPAFHAMLAGRMVIVPAGMGHDDFLVSTSAILVPPAMRTPAFDDVEIDVDPEHGTAKYVFKGPQGVSVHTDWYEPHLIAYTGYMRAAYEQKMRDITMPDHHLASFGRRAVGKLAMDALQGA